MCAKIEIFLPFYSPDKVEVSGFLLKTHIASNRFQWYDAF